MSGHRRSGYPEKWEDVRAGLTGDAPACIVAVSCPSIRAARLVWKSSDMRAAATNADDMRGH